MAKTSIFLTLRELVNFFPEEDKSPLDMLLADIPGPSCRVFSGIIISIFRITSSMAFEQALAITGAYGKNAIVPGIWLVLAILAALLVGRLMRNPAIRFGGGLGCRNHRKAQPHALSRILLPKFVGSWLVMAFGISVGREGALHPDGRRNGHGPEKS